MGVNDKSCVKCGGTERYKSGKCKPCAKAYLAKWQVANREKCRAHSAKWYEANKEKVKVDHAKWHAANRDEVSERKAKWYKTNRERVKENGARWHIDNRERVKAYADEWRKNNPEMVLARKARRRARKANADGDHTAEDWIAILARYGHACLACGATDNIHKDHIVPLAVGGSNWPDNLQPLCATCNCSKATKTIDYRPDINGERAWV